MDLQHCELLDRILKFIATTDFAIADNGSKRIYNALIKKHPTEYHVFLKAIRKLCRDGYLETGTGPFGEVSYELTYEGKAFIKSGGYTSSERKRKYSNNIKRLQHVILAVSATGTVVIGINQCSIAKKANDIQIQINKLKSQ